MSARRSAGIRLFPIGVVRNGVLPAEEVRWEEVVSRLEVNEELLPALEGIEAFSHLMVLFYCHEQPAGPRPLQVHPEQRPDMPLVGVLATRSPRRPNPIGVTVVELLRREGPVLMVRGLDALDGTPVLDVKPYLPRGDRVESARIAGWLERLWALQDEERRHG